jgi:hypothetical protein
MNTNTKPDTKSAGPDLPSEARADLAAIMGQVDGEVIPGAEPEPQAPEVDLAGEIAGLVSMGVALLSPMFPSLKDIYTEQAVGAASGALAGVCQKHGWMQGGMVGGWGEELAAVAIVGPLVFATVQGVKGDMQAKRKKAEPDRLAAPVAGEVIAPKVGEKTVTFGGVASADS